MRLFEHATTPPDTIIAWGKFVLSVPISIKLTQANDSLPRLLNDLLRFSFSLLYRASMSQSHYYPSCELVPMLSELDGKEMRALLLVYLTEYGQEPTKLGGAPSLSRPDALCRTTYRPIMDLVREQLS